MTAGHAPAPGITDTSSPLAQMLGEGVAWKRVRAERGRLAGRRIAVRFLPWDPIEDGQLEAIDFLTASRPGKRRWRDEHLYTELGEAVHDVESQLRVLVRALLVAPESDDAALTEATCVPLVRKADDLRALLSADEVGFLYREFVAFQRECSPLTYAASAEEVEAFVDSLGKGGTPPSLLSTCAPDTLVGIAISLASRYRALMSGFCSPGSPSNDTSGGSATPSGSSPSGDEPTPGTIRVIE